MKVFISHSSYDKKFTRLLKACLIENDISTWFDEDELNLGDSLLKKLENALEESSHFVIILSKASVESDWVQLELKNAVMHQKSGLVDKIIPIKYRECNIPEELQELLHADLTNEVVLPDGEKVKFISDGFDKFFLQLVRALKSPLKSLNTSEKQEIKKALQIGAKINTEKASLIITRGIYLLEGQSPTEKHKYQKDIQNSPTFIGKKEEIRSILLPDSLKSKGELNLGDELEVVGPDLESTSYAHFGGYRKDDLKIVAQVDIRHHCRIFIDHQYIVEFNSELGRITFLEDQSKKVSGTNK